MYGVTSSQYSIQKEVLPSESRDNPVTADNKKLLESVYIKQSCIFSYMCAKIQ